MTKILIPLVIFLTNYNVYGSEVYFDLSEKEIQIETDFNGKEIIIFGIFVPEENTIVAIEGPKKDTKILKKERLFGFWINTKKIIYKKLPTIFFVASSAPIKDILNYESIIKEELYFDELLTNTITQRNFLEQKNLGEWGKNLIRIKTNENLFKEYEFKNIDNKLFQTRVFFPSNSTPGKYEVTIFQVKDQIIQNKKSAIINIRKSGVGEKIYRFAHEQSALYGLLSILFAILSGLIAATIFRRI